MWRMPILLSSTSSTNSHCPWTGNYGFDTGDGVGDDGGDDDGVGDGVDG